MGGGWGMVGSHEVAETSEAKIVLWPNGFNSVHFKLHISQNVATLMPSLTSQSCSNSLLAACLARQDGAIYRPQRHLWMPDRPMNEASVKADH